MRKKHPAHRALFSNTLCTALALAAATTVSVQFEPQRQEATLLFPIKIESVQFADDFDTAVVALKEKPEEPVAVLYEVYRKGSNGLVSAGSMIVNAKTATRRNFRQHFEVPTETGIFTLRFAACPGELHLVSYGIDPERCGAPFTQQVIFAPSGTVCGNAKVEAGEQCDDGNKFGGDGCSAECTGEERVTVCGDWLCEPGEHKENCPADCPDVPAGMRCQDNDSGRNHERKGATTSPYGDIRVGEDFCLGDGQAGTSVLHEYYCFEDRVTFVIVNCEHGCREGACLREPKSECGNRVCEPGEDATLCPVCAAGTPPEKCQCSLACEQDCKNVSCEDSDGGKRYDAKGKAKLSNGYKQDDTCIVLPSVSPVSVLLQESFCEGKRIGTEQHRCDYECRDGACVERPGGGAPPPAALAPVPTPAGLAKFTCGNGICEPGEADTVSAGGCPPGSPPECLGLPSLVVPGTCQPDCSKVLLGLCGNGTCEAGESELRCPPCVAGTPAAQCQCVKACAQDCDAARTLPGGDPCTVMDCAFGCVNGACIVPSNVCDKTLCPYGCANGKCLPPPPAIPAGKLCKASSDCQNGMTCTTEFGDCMPDAACPECGCTGMCMYGSQIQLGPEFLAPETTQTLFIPEQTQLVLPAPSKNWFTDTVNDNDTDIAANLLRDAGVIAGYPDGSFRKANAVIRAEAAKFLITARYGDFPKTGYENRFWDTAEGEWYVPYVMGAANLGIISGYSDGSFRPGNTVTTAEFSKMLAETFDLTKGLPYYYTDVPPEAWFAQYAGIVEEMNLFPGRGQRFQPDRPLTRGEVAFAIALVLTSTTSAQ